MLVKLANWYNLVFCLTYRNNSNSAFDSVSPLLGSDPTEGCARMHKEGGLSPPTQPKASSPTLSQPPHQTAPRQSKPGSHPQRASPGESVEALTVVRKACSHLTSHCSQLEAAGKALTASASRTTGPNASPSLLRLDLSPLSLFSSRREDQGHCQVP